MKTPTLGSPLSSADLCRRNGWQRGTVLEASEEEQAIKIQITAVGDGEVLARELGDEESYEGGWDLTLRDWRKAE